MDDKSPDEYLNDPQFIQVLSTSLSLEITNKEKEIKETNRQIDNLKSVISSDVKDRKRLKQLTQVEQRNKIIFRTTLNNLRKIENEKILELSLVKEKQDDSLLRAQIDQERFLKILETYKETWIKYEAEYEQFPLAIERKKYKNEVEKMKIQCMIQEYKKVEYQKMLKLQNKIDDLKIQSIIIKLSEIIIQRWNKQKKIDELIDEYQKLKIKWNKISQQHKKIMTELELEARNKALARLQMPPPRIDFSFMRAIYTESSPKDQFNYSERLHKRSDSDSVSINTLMLEEICRDESSASLIATQNIREEDNDTPSSDIYDDDINLESSENHVNNETINNDNTEILEKVCRQLSITEETCESSNYKTFEKISSQTELKMHFESQPIQKTFSNEKNNNLKKKAPSIDNSIHTNLETIEKKKLKIDYRHEDFPPVRQDSQKQNLFQTKRSFHDENRLSNSQPQIKNVETITQSLNINIKPPMAEVPPTPSALYSPRLGSTYGSSTNLSPMMDPNIDDSDINWQDLMLARGGSDLSYASSMYVPKKPTVDNNVLKPTTNPQDINVNNFFNFFPTNNQTNKRLF